MEELAIKIAETLDISVQAAIDMYPVIRSQYIWYEALTTMTLWMVLLISSLILIIVVTGTTMNNTDKFYWDMDKGDWNTEKITEEWAIADKVLKKAVLALLVFVVITIAITIVVPFLAPDVMIIKNFLG